MKRERPTINGTGRQTRDFVFVEDVARANLVSIEKANKDFAFYNISQGVETNINELFKLLAGKMGVDISPQYNLSLKGEVKRSCLDNRMAKKELGWSPEYDFEAGIDKTIDYFKIIISN